jgi:SAM-dependent methyltransferase
MRCLVCNSDDLHPVLDLGRQPLANYLLERPDDPFGSYPLGLMCCADCSHGQLSHFASPEDLFRHYLYASGTSGSLGKYFDWFCDETVRMFPAGSDILEIACNDGSLLARLQSGGFNLLGVDPASNLTVEARARGLEVIDEFWPCPDALGGRKFDLIVGMNVAAHNPDPYAFMTGVAAALKANGVCVIQTSQANMLANGEFDTIYHEHFSFFTPNSMAVLARRAGLELRAIELVDVHGVSFAFVLAKPDCRRDVSTYLTTPPYGLRRLPLPAGNSCPVSQYEAFGKAARERMARVSEICAGHRAAGRDICFVGAAAKAITFLHAAGIKPDYVYDEAPLKIGRYIPGVGAPILPLTEVVAARDPLIVMAAWNFREELTAKVRRLTPGARPRFLVYFPQVEEYQFEAGEQQ